jgi:hypothetical protein
MLSVLLVATFWVVGLSHLAHLKQKWKIRQNDMVFVIARAVMIVFNVTFHRRWRSKQVFEKEESFSKCMYDIADFQP